MKIAATWLLYAVDCSMFAMLGAANSQNIKYQKNIKNI